MDEEKALGIFWDVSKDEFYFKLDISAGGKKVSKKIDLKPYLGGDTTLPLSKALPPISLTIRICLSIHAKTHDPLGLVLPVKMIGTLLFRETLQNINKTMKSKGRIPWDTKIDEEFTGKWLEYFKVLNDLNNVRFPRSMKPEDVDDKVDPVLITFSDGNPDAFGTVAYALWTLLDGTKAVRLIMSKAKISPLQYKGETTRNELAGATFAVRIKSWIMENSGLKFGDYIPFLDSRIVQAMIKKDSYGFNTFAGLRVAEIQQKSDVSSWRHLPSSENISDILTRGARTEMIAQGSVWQCGPAWLIKDETEWPVTRTESKLSETEKEDVQKYLKSQKEAKTYSSSATVDTEIKNSPSNMEMEGPRCQVLKLLHGAVAVEPIVVKSLPCEEMENLIERCGNLEKLIRSTAYVLRLMGRRPLVSGVREIVEKTVSTEEYDDAWRFLINLEQRKLDLKKQRRLRCSEIEVELSNKKRLTQIILSPRMKNFPISFSSNKNIPVVPSGNFAKLIALFYHNKYHTDIESVVA